MTMATHTGTAPPFIEHIYVLLSHLVFIRCCIVSGEEGAVIIFINIQMINEAQSRVMCPK